MASKVSYVRSITVRGVADGPLTLDDLRVMLQEADEADYPGESVLTITFSDPYLHTPVRNLTLGTDE